MFFFFFLTNLESGGFKIQDFLRLLVERCFEFFLIFNQTQDVDWTIRALPSRYVLKEEQLGHRALFWPWIFFVKSFAVAWLGCRGDFLDFRCAASNGWRKNPSAKGRRRWFCTTYFSRIVDKTWMNTDTIIDCQQRHPKDKLLGGPKSCFHILSLLEVFWGLKSFETVSAGKGKILSWIVVKNLFSVVKNVDFFLPGDTSQQKPILFSTATELELGPGVAESPTSKIILMEFKVRSEHGSVWFLSVSISTIWKLEVLIKTLIPYVYTVCVVDKKCSGVLSSWYQSCKWHGVTTSALVKQPFLPGLKTQAAWASWSWPSGATDFYSKSANPSKLAFSHVWVWFCFLKQKIAGVLHVSGFGGFSHFWNPLEVSHFHSPASGGGMGACESVVS